MDEKHKIKIKIGNHEFEAEGDQAVVDQQLKMFMELISRIPASTPDSSPQQSSMQDRTGAASSDPGDMKSADITTDVDQGLIDRVFSLNKDVVSLRVLPKTKSYAADTFLLLLYGYGLLKKEHDVLGTQLMKAGRQSGLQVDRVDRAISFHREYYNRGGARRSARYALNNRGIEKAKEILRLML